MKRIFLLMLSASLIVACDKTENEAEIAVLFLGISEAQPKLIAYDQAIVTENAYFQKFNSLVTWVSVWHAIQNKHR